MFRVNNKDTIYSKLTIKTPERRQWRPSRDDIVNFEHISYLFLLFLLLSKCFGRYEANFLNTLTLLQNGQ